MNVPKANNPFLAFIILLVLFIFTIRTKVGYALVYYFVAGSIIIVWIVSYHTITNIFGNNQQYAAVPLQQQPLAKTGVFNPPLSYLGTGEEI